MTDTAPPYISNRPPQPARRRPRQVGSENTRLLQEIGYTVRNERAKRGITRKMLARQSNMSERYIAQIEAGFGNPSVLTLDAIARALGVHLFDLLPAVNQDEARRRALVHLRELPVEEVKGFLNAFVRVGGAIPSVRGRRLALVGLRGAGKSTLGGMLAERLGVPFIELDKMIERDRGAPVSTLFEVYGQGTFRRYERDALTRAIAAHPAAVIATAGGIVADETTFGQLLDQTYVVWLRASADEHMRRVREQGDLRPMSHNPSAMEDLISIIDARAPAYGRAHARIDTSDRTVMACLEELEKIARELFASNLSAPPSA